MNIPGAVGAGPRDVTTGAEAAMRGRPHVLFVIGSQAPRPAGLRAAAWLGRRLRAQMLVVGAVEYRPPRDELVQVRVEAVRGIVAATVKRLMDDGVDTGGTVVLVHDGGIPAAVDDLADEQEADLVAVAAHRRSWFWVFPGSLVAHQLTRAGRRPVLIIPDHGPGLVAQLTDWIAARGTADRRTVRSAR